MTGKPTADTMIGQEHKGALVTADEHKSKLRLTATSGKQNCNGDDMQYITLLGVFKNWVHVFSLLIMGRSLLSMNRWGIVLKEKNTW